MPATPANVLEAARAWISGDPDPETVAELEALVQADDAKALGERLAGPLTFGTAGLRAAVGAGSARMNRATVIRATRGLADYLSAHRDGARSLPVVVGHDARTTSPAFAQEVVAVLIAGKGHETYQIVGPVTLAFDDRVEARRALAARRGGV